MIYFGENQLYHSSFDISWANVLTEGLKDRLHVSLFLITKPISPHTVRWSKTVMDAQDWTGFYAVDFRFQVLESGFPVSGIIDTRIPDFY